MVSEKLEQPKLVHKASEHWQSKLIQIIRISLTQTYKRSFKEWLVFHEPTHAYRVTYAYRVT